MTDEKRPLSGASANAPGVPLKSYTVTVYGEDKTDIPELGGLVFQRLNEQPSSPYTSDGTQELTDAIERQMAGHIVPGSVKVAHPIVGAPGPENVECDVNITIRGHELKVHTHVIDQHRCDCCQLWEDKATGLTAYGEYFLCDTCLGDLNDDCR